ncbi:hypothetical protein A2Z56_03680 [Candidatus Kaiserbacteria bacterium RIFCSPHIGHO2_12_45_16]|nr:MAG: hypothetical protein A2Z56_03680 [Candidatus Kaiserbacteria bacterium RIFCSPHIGHO2_12_45_16]
MDMEAQVINQRSFDTFTLGSQMTFIQFCIAELSESWPHHAVAIASKWVVYTQLHGKLVGCRLAFQDLFDYHQEVVARVEQAAYTMEEGNVDFLGMDIWQPMPEQTKALKNLGLDGVRPVSETLEWWRPGWNDQRTLIFYDEGAKTTTSVYPDGRAEVLED